MASLGCRVSGFGFGHSVAYWRTVLGRNIGRLASQPGYSKSDLAAHLGIKPQQLSRYINGDDAPLKYLDQIRAYFDVKFSDLFQEDPDAPMPAPKAEEPANPEELFRDLGKALGFRVSRSKRKKLSNPN